MVDTVSAIDLARLPVKEEERNFGSWHIKCKSSHILHSKCIESECSKHDLSKCCLFCKFSQEVALPHLPDMVFANNILSLNYKNLGRIEFNAIDALKRVENGKMTLKIACSEEWKEARLSTGLADKEILPFDWTFTTDYQGSLIGDWLVEDCIEEQINWDRLKQKDEILFFNELTLFEDELHDNGISELSVKVRVMPWGFFVLLRYFLRIDNVLIRAFDTRLYHEFDNDFIIRETNARESKIADLKDPSISIRDQAEVVPLIPLKQSKNQKLRLKSK